MKQKIYFLIAVMLTAMMVNLTSCKDGDEDLTPILNKDFSYKVDGNFVTVITEIHYVDWWITFNGTEYHRLNEDDAFTRVFIPDAGTYKLIYSYVKGSVTYTSEEVSVTIDADYKPILDKDFTAEISDNNIVVQSELEYDEMWVTYADKKYSLVDGNISIPTDGLGNYNFTFSYKSNSKIYTSETVAIDITTPVLDFDFKVSVSKNNATIKCDRDYKLMWVTFLDNNFVLMNGEVSIPLPHVGTHSMTFSYEDNGKTYTSKEFDITTNFPVNGTDYTITVKGNYVIIENKRNEDYRYCNSYVNYSDSTYLVSEKYKNNKVRIFIREPGTYSMSFFYEDDEQSTFYVSIIDDYMPNIQAVDLGLSVKWANMNIDASSPEDVGGFYSWGNTEGLGKFSYGANRYLTKYCCDSEYGENGFTDNLTVLQPMDDVANVRLGGNWRMPTSEECLELVKNTEHEWTDNYKGSGVAGIIFTSKIDGYTDVSIFLPATGDYTFGYRGYYWSSSLGYWIGTISNEAETLYINDLKEPGARDQYSKEKRYASLAVRPVCTK